MKFIRDNIGSIIFGVMILLIIAILIRLSQSDKEEEYAPVAPVQVEETEAEAENLVVVERVEIREDEDEQPFSFKVDPDIPFDIQDAAHYYGNAYHISPQLLIAIAWQESHWDPSAESKGCIGLMQVYEKWHTDRMERLNITHEDLYTVDGSMHTAADYLAELFSQYEDPAEVLMIYNGDSSVEAYRQGGEASDYANEILWKTRELEISYDAL